MLHPLVRWLGQRALRWFYRELTFVGRERIPATGPVLLIGNHWNDIPDALCGFLTTTRPVRYVATISAAVTPIGAATYRGLGIIPVIRVRDVRKMRHAGIEVRSMNDDAFRLVTEALRDGDVVGVFPEGGVHDGPSLGHFRAGVAKMALDGAVDGAIEGVHIVPFGVQYEARRTPGSDVHIQVGEPILLDRWLETAGRSATRPGTRERAAVALALRDRMRDALRSVTRNAATFELAAAAERTTAAVAAVISGAEDSLPGVACQVQAACGERAATDLAVWTQDGVRVANSLLAHADAVATAVERAGGMAVSARDCARVLDVSGVDRVAPDWPSRLLSAALTPAAAVGWLVHAPIFFVIWRLARQTPDTTMFVARACIPGLYLILCWYAVTGALLAIVLHALSYSAWLALPAVMLLPSLGDAAVWWRHAVRAWQLRRRVRRWTEADRAALRTAAGALRTAWFSHEQSADVTPIVSAAVPAPAPAPARAAASTMPKTST